MKKKEYNEEMRKVRERHPEYYKMIVSEQRHERLVTFFISLNFISALICITLLILHL